jgi:sigma-B regulation protein RsbU (phosphoserine phosphatase)
MDTAGARSTRALPDDVLAMLAEIGEEISASLDLDKVLGRVASLVMRLMDSDTLGVLLLDAQTQTLSYRFASGYRPEIVANWRIPVGQGIPGMAAASRAPVRVPDLREDSRHLGAVDAARSELAVPLMFHDQVVGVLDVHSKELNHFSQQQEDILVLLASRLSVAIENARLFERTQAQAATLLLLNEVGREASAILDPEDLLRRAAELVKRVIDYQIMSILLFDPASQCFLQRLAVKYGQSIQGKLRVHLTEGLIGRSATTRMPVNVPDVTIDPSYIMVNPETRSELAIPMIFKGNVIGVLDLESPQANYFTADHEQTLSILAAQLAVALENARLYEKVTRDEARMERELLAAQRIQGALLRPVPADDYGIDLAARILSAREVCGDLYDFLRYGPTRLGFALGDVSGKGSAAALYGAVGIGILRSMAPLKLFPAELLRQLNQMICERRIEGRFMTMCFATWGKTTRKLRLANAGQNQPLLLRGGRCEQLNLVGFPLGIFEDVTYEEWSVNLDPGDVLVFHSDGLSEAPDVNGREFGVPRLAALIEQHSSLGSGALADRLMSEVNQFTEGAPLQDDRTLVVMKVL